MKTNIIINSLLFGFFLASSQKLFAQQEIKGQKQLFELNIDELGDADIALTMTLNAQQWDMFKQNMGNNQAGLKRMIERGMPSAFLSDFKYEEDPMERTYAFRMKAKAATQLDKNGKWIGELDMKDPDISKISDNEFRLDMNMLVGGGLVDQTQKIILPKNAKNAKVEKDSFGKAVLTYELNSTSTGFAIAKYAGGFLALAGFGLLFFRLKGKQDGSQM